MRTPVKTLGVLLRQVAGRVPWLVPFARLGRHDSGIRDRLASHAMGADRLAELERLHRQSGRSVERLLVEMLPCVRGTARERLSRLAAELGLVTRWQQQTLSPRTQVRRQALARLVLLSGGLADAVLLAALLDSQESIRLEVSRALLGAGGQHDVEEVFASVMAQPPEIRTALAEELRPHALMLCESAIPEALRSNDPARLSAVLELLEGWGKALPLPDLLPLLHHPDPDIRYRAFRVLPYLANVRALEPEILRALQQDEARVKAAACLAAARLRIESALPLLVRSLRDPDSDLALAAASALAEMGSCGLLALEDELSLAWEPEAAAAALKAIDRARSSHYGYTQL